jgi:hypothetical protein
MLGKEAQHQGSILCFIHVLNDGNVGFVLSFRRCLRQIDLSQFFLKTMKNFQQFMTCLGSGFYSLSLIEFIYFFNDILLSCG